MIDDREINIPPKTKLICICYFRISRYLTYVLVEEQIFSKVRISKKGFSIRRESTFSQKFLVNPSFRCKKILSLITEWNWASSKLSSWNLMSITGKPPDIEVLDTSLEIWLSYFLKIFVQSPLIILNYFKKWTKLFFFFFNKSAKRKKPPLIQSLRKRKSHLINFKTFTLLNNRRKQPTWFQASTIFRKSFPHAHRCALINASLVRREMSEGAKKKEKDGSDSTGQRLGRTTPRVHASIQRAHTYS